MSGARPSAAATAGPWVLGLLVAAGLGCNGDPPGATGTGSTGAGATTETTPTITTTTLSTTTASADTTATTRSGADDLELTTTFGPELTTTFGPEPTTTGPGTATRGGGEGGTCCIPHGTAGCDVPGIQACVCGYDRYCCASEWDALCVEQAINDCLAICMGVGTDTDTDPTTATDGEGGDCCMAHATRGCDDETCEAAVCGLDPVCCEEQWDGLCADQAVTACPFLCSHDTTG